MPVDTPAYVQQPSFVTNGVKVQAGTNWDVSRTAVATPIVPLADPQPVHPSATEGVRHAFTQYQPSDRVPLHQPSLSVGFSGGGALLTAEARGALRSLSRGEVYVVIGHADHDERHAELVSRQRANTVAAQLKRQGFKVAAVKSFGHRRALTPASAGANRRVDIVIR
jgi:outer membrane protein OmpA-like peptidoglycan-associated protein